MKPQILIGFETRLVEVNLAKIARLSQEHGDTAVGHFHGFFQYRDGDEADCYAIIELRSGAVIQVTAERVKFIDIDCV